MQAQKTEILLDIIDCLFEIDNSPTGSIGNAIRRKLDIKTTFGNKRSTLPTASINDRVSEDHMETDPN